jgi:uncharacterized membrane protein
MDNIFSKKNAILWIMALAVIVRIIALGKSFQGDEFFSIMDARTFANIPDALLSDTHPPLYFYLLHFWMKISMSEAFLRILSVIPGLGLCLGAYLIGRYAFDEIAGSVSALIVALAPIAVWSSQYIRTYSLAAFFTVFSVFFLIRLLKDEEPGRFDWAGYIACSAMAMYTFYFSALVIIAENVFIATFMRKKEFLKSWLLSQAAIFALYIPWIPFFYFQRSSYVGHPQMVEQVGFYIGRVHVGALIRSLAGLAGFDPRLFSKHIVSAHGIFVAVSLAIVMAGAILAAWRVVEFFRSAKAGPEKGRTTELLFFLAVLPFLLALFLHQAFGIILMSHYFIASFIFLALFSTAVMVKTLSKKVQLVMLLLVIILYVSRLSGMYQDKEMDFKSAHAYIKVAMAKDTVLVSPSFGGAFDHYFFDIPNRRLMEDPKTPSLLGKDVIAITYPAKLELKNIHKRFNAFVSSRGYRSGSPKAFGDLIVERYTR